MPNYKAGTINRGLKESISQYPLITGEGNTAKDVVGHYDGTITNGGWVPVVYN